MSTMRLSTDTESDLSQAVDEATAAIRNGDLVVMPTDTVYGVAADAFAPAAVQKLLDAKERGRQMPPPVLISSAATLEALATDVPAFVRQLTDAFWPGALTIVCRQQPSLRWDLGETRGTVAVRVPDNAVALAVLEKTGPLAVSSANLSGQPAATDVSDAEDMLAETVAVYLDGGASTSSEASTIIDVTGFGPRILRQGAISLESINAVLEPTGVVAAAVGESPMPPTELTEADVEAAIAAAAQLGDVEADQSAAAVDEPTVEENETLPPPGEGKATEQN